jgi:hypothetical protein
MEHKSNDHRLLKRTKETLNRTLVEADVQATIFNQNVRKVTYVQHKLSHFNRTNGPAGAQRSWLACSAQLSSRLPLRMGPRLDRFRVSVGVTINVFMPATKSSSADE